MCRLDELQQFFLHSFVLVKLFLKIDNSLVDLRMLGPHGVNLLAQNSNLDRQCSELVPNDLQIAPVIV